MKKIWNGIRDVMIFGVVFVAAVTSGPLIALTIGKVIPFQYGVIGLIITFGVIISGIISYWKNAKKDDTP